MGYKLSEAARVREERLQKAILAYNEGQYSSYRKAAEAFEVSHDTLRRRIGGGRTAAEAKETCQLLSREEEAKLAQYILLYGAGGAPVSPALAVEMAHAVMARRFKHGGGVEARSGSIGEQWFHRFLRRNPTLQSLYARKLDQHRFNGANPAVLQHWFDAVSEMMAENNYHPKDIWNMDESGFAVGTSQTTRVLVKRGAKQPVKSHVGKQEWITDIECINAAGQALSPMLIFKARNFNAAWVPPELGLPDSWHFAVSESGWTTDALGLTWLTEVFEPESSGIAAGQRRLLIMDGHGSHIRSDFIIHCIEHGIDFMIMPAHCSHLLQPLDVGVFSDFKRAHGQEMDRYSRLSSQRITKTEWLEMYARARAKSMTARNIRTGWKYSGLQPLNPALVLEKVSIHTVEGERPETPLHQLLPPASEQLRSSPLQGTELHQTNQVLRRALESGTGLVTPTKRYISRIANLSEAQQTEITLLRKQVEEQAELLARKKTLNKGKRVQLEGVHVYSTAEVLRICQEAEAATERSRKKPRAAQDLDLAQDSLSGQPTPEQAQTADPGPSQQIYAPFQPRLSLC